MRQFLKWLVAFPFILLVVFGLPALITNNWDWSLENAWDTAFSLLWFTSLISGTLFYKPGEHRKFPGHTRLIFSMVLLVVPLLAVYDHVNCQAEKHSMLWSAAGLAIFLIGTVIGVRAGRALNQWYAPDPTILPGQRLITTGPYRHIRHPMYTALLLTLPSLPLLLHSVLASGVSLMFILPGLWLRIREEEAILLDEFTDEYRKYMAHSWRLVPFIY